MFELVNTHLPEMDLTASEAELSTEDIALAIQQCEIQHATSPEQTQGMNDALAEAKAVAFSDAVIDAETIFGLITSLGSKIEPTKAAQWRIVPVTFENGERGLHPDNIPEAVYAWSQAFAEQRADPTELYYEFELIHPMEDGNGRIGHCLWAIAVKRQTGDWPSTLPPNVFDQGYTPQRKSAFGDIQE